MTRSSVDLPQPDGPMSETNSPGAMSRSMPLSATVSRPPSRVVNTLSTPRIRTTAAGVRPGRPAPAGHASTPGRPRRTMHLRDADHEEEHDPEHAGDEDRRPQLLGPGDVVLVEGRDHAPEPLRDAAGVLADDGADDAGRRGDLERGEEVRHRRRQAQLGVDPRRDAPYERISSSARGSNERRPRIIAIVTGKNVR